MIAHHPATVECLWGCERAQEGLEDGLLGAREVAVEHDVNLERRLRVTSHDGAAVALHVGSSIRHEELLVKECVLFTKRWERESSRSMNPLVGLGSRRWKRLTQHETRSRSSARTPQPPLSMSE